MSTDPDMFLRVVTGPVTAHVHGAEWTLLGTATSDGLTYASSTPPGEAHPCDTVPAEPTMTILDQIDAAVGELCACGCGVPLDPDGPSAYFATQHCQRRWHDQHVTDPGDVYGRLSAAEAYPGQDTRPVPLSGPPPQPEADQVDTPPAGPAAIPLDLCADPLGAGYRRYCAHCNTLVIPQVLADQDPTEIYTWGCADVIRVVPSALRARCSTCRADLPGPVYHPVVVVEPDRLVLQLGDGTVRTQRPVSMRVIRQTRDRDDLFARIWAYLEEQIAVFRQRWRL